MAMVMHTMARMLIIMLMAPNMAHMLIAAIIMIPQMMYDDGC